MKYFILIIILVTLSGCGATTSRLCSFCVQPQPATGRTATERGNYHTCDGCAEEIEKYKIGRNRELHDDIFK